MPTTLRNTDILFNDGTTQSSGAGAGFVSGVLAIANGGTASTSAAAARTALGADNASNLTSGTVGTARLGSGTANSTTFLRGDQTWATAGGVPTFDDIGSVSQFWFSGTSNTTAGNNVSGANLFRITAAAAADTAVQQQGMSNLDLNQFPGAAGDFRGRTTALSANSRTVSPVSGTWRLQTYALRSYFDGEFVTRYYSVLAIRVA